MNIFYVSKASFKLWFENITQKEVGELSTAESKLLANKEIAQNFEASDVWYGKFQVIIKKIKIKNPG